VQRVEDGSREGGARDHAEYEAGVLEEGEPEAAAVAVRNADQYGNDDDDVDQVDGAKGTGPSTAAGCQNSVRRNLDNWRVIYLIGEWIPAWGWMSLAFLVATLGVVGLGFWVMRADHLNRRFDDVASEESTNTH
jgi:hypothetical protein